VILSHAAGWGQIAMYDWILHIRETVDPAYNPLGGFSYYVLLSIRLIFSFSVAAFLYVSAWFVTYAVGKQSTLSWKAIRMRIYALLGPYLIWSIIIIAGNCILKQRDSVFGYLQKLFSTGVDGPYYYVPLLCYLLLLSPFLIPLARNHWKLLLIVTGAIQAAVMVIHYLGLVNKGPVITTLGNITPDWSVPRWIFYFSFGLVSGFHANQIKAWATKIRWQALTMCFILIFLATFEYTAVYRYTEAGSPTHRGIGWGDAPITLFTTLYALTFLIYFQTLDVKQSPFTKILYPLGKRSYGLYLIHMKAMEFIARLIYHFAPIILLYQIVYQPILWLFGFGGALLMMFVVENTPTRKYYRLIFG
jgi:peptidoglycan/LPS O-acetylase OafA/YrhL